MGARETMSLEEILRLSAEVMKHDPELAKLILSEGRRRTPYLVGVLKRKQRDMTVTLDTLNKMEFAHHYFYVYATILAVLLLAAASFYAISKSPSSWLYWLTGLFLSVVVFYILARMHQRKMSEARMEYIRKRYTYDNLRYGEDPYRDKRLQDEILLVMFYN